MHAATATIEIPVEAAIPISTGEPGDLEQLFREHHRLVFRTAYRVTGNAGDAEDVLQTVFLRLAGRPSSAPPLENPEHYLRRAAVNTALDVVRSRHPEDMAPAGDLPRTDPTQDVQSELRECLRRALAQLSSEAAEVFALRFLEGHSNREIAAMLGVSQVWVAVTVYRARQRLQREIRSYRREGGRHS